MLTIAISLYGKTNYFGGQKVNVNNKKCQFTANMLSTAMRYVVRGERVNVEIVCVRTVYLNEKSTCIFISVVLHYIGYVLLMI